MSDEPLPQSEIILYQTEVGRTRVQCRFENETVWLTQALIAELFEKDVRTINEHLVNIFDEGELRREAIIRKVRIVRIEGARQVTRAVEHYHLDAIMPVGFRVRSHQGTQFRRACRRLDVETLFRRCLPTVFSLETSSTRYSSSVTIHRIGGTPVPAVGHRALERVSGEGLHDG